MVLVAAGGGQNTAINDYLLDFSRAEPVTPEEFERRQIAIWEAATGKKATYIKGGTQCPQT